MTRGRRIAVAAAIVAFLAGIGVWGWKANAKAERLALADEIERERKARLRPASPSEPPIPEAEDAAPLWKAAIEAMDDSVINDMSDATGDPDWKEVPAVVLRAVEAHAKAFSLADEAASRIRCSPMPAGQLGHNLMFRLGTLVEARGRATLYRRDGAAALVCVRTLRAIGRDAPRIPLTEMFAWSYPFAAHCLQRDALDLLARVSGTPGLGVEEEALVVTVGAWNLREFQDESFALRRDALDRDFINLLTMGPEEWMQSMGIPLPSFGERLGRLFRGKKSEESMRFPSVTGIRRIRPLLDRLEDAARRRDVVALAPGGALETEQASKVKDDPLGFVVVMRPGNARVAIAVEAQLEVVRAALALQVFEKRNGRPAASWDEVVPAILPSIPLDPGDGKPIRFHVRPGGGAAWSVLAEGPWADEQRKEDERLKEGGEGWKRTRLRIEWGTPPKAGDGRK